jgi:hypothetical protein
MSPWPVSWPDTSRIQVASFSVPIRCQIFSSRYCVTGFPVAPRSTNTGIQPENPKTLNHWRPRHTLATPGLSEVGRTIPLTDIRRSVVDVCLGIRVRTSMRLLGKFVLC